MVLWDKLLGLSLGRGDKISFYRIVQVVKPGAGVDAITIVEANGTQKQQAKNNQG